MTARKNISRTLRARVFDKANGCCHLCAGKITASDKWDVDHVLALALGGADDESNFAPAHKACHQGKSAVDVGMIRKADRQRANFIGARPRRAWPGTEKFKKRLDGTVVRREP